MVFGVFDGIHEGHRAFFKEAKSHGDYLIAVVAPDHVVEHLKGKMPAIDIGWRLEALKKEDGVAEVVMGDDDLGTWDVVKKYRPAVIALGYDQTLLKKDIESAMKQFNWNPEIKMMNANEPNMYHSSILNH